MTDRKNRTAGNDLMLPEMQSCWQGTAGTWETRKYHVMSVKEVRYDLGTM